MALEAEKAIVERYVQEVVNRRNVSALDDLVAPDLLNHAAPPDLQRGVENWRQVLSRVPKLGPERSTVEDLIAEDDKVVLRLRRSGTHKATGRKFSIENVHIFRFANGKIVEHWAVRDDLGLMRQIGAQ